MQKRFDLVLKTQITNDPKHLRKCTLYVKYCTESSRNGFFVYKTGEFNMMYTLLWIKNPERAKMIYDISKTGLLLQSEAYKFCHIYWNIARGTTDPGYWFYNLRNLSARIVHSEKMCQNFK